MASAEPVVELPDDGALRTVRQDQAKAAAQEERETPHTVPSMKKIWSEGIHEMVLAE